MINNRFPADPLVASLAIMTRLLGHEQTAASLSSGLPFTSEPVTPDLLQRAAEQAGFVLRHVTIPLDKIHPLTLPVILMLNDGHACVLTGWDDDDQAQIIFPDTAPGETLVSRQELMDTFSGQAFFVRLNPDQSPGPAVTKKRQEQWFWSEIRRHSGVLSRVVFASIMVNVLTLASPLFVMNVYDRVVPNNAMESLAALSIGVGLAFFFDFLLKNLRYHFVDLTGRNLDTLLSNRIFAKVLAIQMGARTFNAGALSNQIRSFDRLRDFFSSATLLAFVDLPFGIIFILVIWMLAGPVAYIPVIGALAVITVGLMTQTKLLEFMRKRQARSSRKNAHLVESIQMLESVKSLGVEGWMQKTWEKLVDDQAETVMQQRGRGSRFLFFAAFVGQLVYVGIVVAGVFQVTNGTLSLGGLIACAILSSRVMQPLLQTAQLLTRLQQARVAMTVLNDIMAIPEERPEHKRFVHREKLRGAVEFQQVGFRYASQKNPSISQLSFRIQPGERVGILGRIGSGKSTLLKLILGLQTPQTGSILIDDVDIGQLDPAEVRHGIGYVAQDIPLFSGTIRHNLMMVAPQARDDDIWEALKVSGMDRVVQGHPLGLERPVGPGGSFLSLGERQSLALTRIFLQSNALLLLDEPTSMLDMSTEQQLIQRLKGRLSDETVIVITQRMNILQLVDRLIVLENGNAIADGPRDQVIEQLQQQSAPQTSQKTPE